MLRLQLFFFAVRTSFSSPTKNLKSVFKNTDAQGFCGINGHDFGRTKMAQGVVLRRSERRPTLHRCCVSLLMTARAL